MKRLISAILIMLILLNHMSFVSMASEQYVDIPDAKLKYSICYQLGKPSYSNLTKEDMESLESLTFVSEIRNLEGLQYAVNLKTLDISGWTVENLSCISFLTKLEHLRINFYNIDNLDFLSNCKNLKTLSASSCNIQNIDALSNCKQLTDLNLSNNNISEISALSELTELKNLHLESNKITDISPISNLNKLENLFILSNNITEIDALENIGPSCTLLSFSYNHLDLSPASNATRIINLLNCSYVNTQIGDLRTDISCLPDEILLKDRAAVANLRRRYEQLTEEEKVFIKNYDKLVAAEAKLSEILNSSELEPVEFGDINLKNFCLEILGFPEGYDLYPEDMENLTEIAFNYAGQHREISSLKGLEYAINLEHLRLYDGTISDLTPLQNLHNLRSLSLNGHNISDITPILNLSNLTSLGLGRNQISEIDSLSKLSHLKELYIDSNKVKDISVITKLPNLTYFDASDNLIETLPPLTHLNNEWWRIYLSDNYISDITPINGVTANKIVLSGNCIEQPLGFTLYDWSNIDLGTQRQCVSVISDINKLPEFSSIRVMHQSKVSSIRQKFNNLPENEKPYVYNISVLEAAEQRLSELEDIPLEQVSHLIFDVNLRYALSSTGYVTTHDLYCAESIDVTNETVYTLQGISLCTNLKELAIDGRYITDYSPLYELQNLKSLKIISMSPEHISILQNFPNLEKLDLSDCSGSDFLVIRQLKNLKSLNLSNTNINSIDFLADLDNLASLNISNTKLNASQISKISDLSQLKELYAANAKISSLDFLVGLSSLEVLDLSDNLIASVEQISVLTSLTKLNLKNNNIGSLQDISGLSNLSELDVTNTGINSLQPLLNSSKLTVLKSGQNNITDISPLLSHEGLTELDLSDNSLTEVSEVIKQLDNLNALNLSHNMISDISFLAKKINTPLVVDLSYNQITSTDTMEVKGYDGKKYYYSLDLSHNKISSILQLSDYDFHTLNLSYNEVDYVTPVHSIKSLRVLDLRYNYVTQTSGISINENCEVYISPQMPAAEVQKDILKLPPPAKITAEDYYNVLNAYSHYKNLDEDQKSRIDPSRLLELVNIATQKNENKQKALDLDKQLASIPSASNITVEHWKTIQDYRVAYNGLTEEAKSYINSQNYKKLTNAEAALSKLNLKVTSSDCVIDPNTKYVYGVPLNTSSSQLISMLIGAGDRFVLYNTSGQIYTGDKLGTGMIIRLYDGNKVVEELTVVIHGDNNGDGTINSLDLLAIKKNLLGQTQITGVYAYASDTNKDNKLNSLDLLAVKKHILGQTSLNP